MANKSFSFLISLLLVVANRVAEPIETSVYSDHKQSLACFISLTWLHFISIVYFSVYCTVYTAALVRLVSFFPSLLSTANAWCWGFLVFLACSRRPIVQSTVYEVRAVRSTHSSAILYIHFVFISFSLVAYFAL